MIELDVVKFFSNLKQGDVFCICLALSLITFIVNFVLMLSVRGYGQKKRLWQYIVYVSAVILQVASDVFSKSHLPISIYLVAILLFMSLPSVIIKQRVIKTTKNQVELIRTLDEKIKKESNFNSFDDEEEFENTMLQPKQSSVMDCVDRLNKCLSKPIMARASENQDSQIAKLDFSHVKNVISRLDAFGLNQSDRKLVEDLKIAVALAEKGEQVVGLKNKINDGLGALLKIMSKYGV